MQRALTLLACLTLAACGDAGPLRPADGASLPPQPELAAEQPVEFRPVFHSGQCFSQRHE